MGTCPNCPLRYRHDEKPPEGTRSRCDCEIEKLRQEKAAGAALESPSNMMVNDVGKPMRAPLNRAERRRQEAQQRRRQH